MQEEAEVMASDAECVVSGPLAATLVVSRFVGTSPLRFVKKGGTWRVSFCKSYSLYGSVVITIGIFIVVSLIIHTVQDYGKDRFVWAACTFMATALVATVVYGAPGRMRCLIRSLNQVQKISSELNVHHWPMPWTKKLIALFVVWETVSLIIVMTDGVLMWSADLLIGQTWTTLACTSQFFYFWIMQLVHLEFVLFALHVRSCFTSVNDSLKSLIRVYISKETLQQQSVRGIAVAYAAACDVVRDVDSSYGLMLMMALGTIFLFFISMSYYFIVTLLTHITMNQLISICFELNQFFWCIYQFVNLVMLNECCHLTHVEMENTRELVARLLRSAHSVPDPVGVELEQFCTLLELNRPIYYQPLNVVTMGRGLVLKILGSITTYLVVLIDLK